MSKLQRDPDKEAFWRLAVSEQQGSSMSVRGFCRREGLSEASFYAWRRELQKRDAEVGESVGVAAEGGRQAALPEKLAERRLEESAGEEDRRGNSCGSSYGSFVEVCAWPAMFERTPGPSAAGAGGDAAIELVLRRGPANAVVEIVVRVRAGFDAPLLRQLVEVLS